MGVASLVLGICSIVFSIISFGCLAWISIILGIIGIVLGAIDIKKKNNAGLPSGMSKAGLACSIIGLCMALVIMFIFTAAASAAVI